MPTTRLGFNPRRPRGRRRESFGSFHTLLIVSSHAAREGGDVLLRPHRGGCRVSIHAAREGGDRKTWAACPCLPSFNPRRPRGRRRAATPAPRRLPRFNPRRPRGRRPKDVGSVPVSSQFQSTPPARAATCCYARPAEAAAFQSTPPARAATERRGQRARVFPVSIHAAREGGDPP